MLVWQLHQGHQQQLQGEAKAEDTRQKNLWQSPSQAKGFIPHPQPQPMDSFPDEAFDSFIFSPHHTEDSFNSFGLWGIAREAAKLSSQSSSICGKTLPLHLSLCQLPWAEEEEEDDSEQVIMKGFTEMLCRAGLHCLLFRTFQDFTHIFWHPKIFQGLANQRVLPPFSTCCSLCCFGGFCHLHTFYLLCQFETLSAGRKQSPTCCPGARAQKQNFHIMG